MSQEITQNKRANGIVTPKNPQKRGTFRKFMKGRTSVCKLRFLRRMKTLYDLYSGHNKAKKGV